MKKLIALLIFMTTSSGLLFSQSDTVVLLQDKAEKIKTGWTFGALPAIAFDTDIGFKYGGVVNFYNYGDGTNYPKYRHSIYLEWSRTTKGSGINQFTYDSEYLIPGIRVSAEASLLTEKALDFYGFNGYEAWYNPAFEDDDNPEYISRMYYRLDRRLTRIKAEFQGKITSNEFRWFAGAAHYNNLIGSVDIDNLNQDLDEDKLLPDTMLLYDKYLDWGLIPEEQANGGVTNLVKLGLVYDTRDNEPNPMTGIWTDLQFLLAPSFMGNGDLSYSRLALTHRQYFTILPKRLSLAYRLSYQAKISGEMPFYMLSYVYNMPPSLTRDGLGGAKTLRGILRNRVVGEDFVYGNFELRWKFLRTVIFNQNIYIALSSFVDGGMITGKYKLPEITSPDAIYYLGMGDNEMLHTSYGAGLHFAMNENFIIAIDYGLAGNPGDGQSGLYMGLNFLY
ncbi:MAG: Omp85 family outer membrane protein [Bacteroidota bacterium]